MPSSLSTLRRFLRFWELWARDCGWWPYIQEQCIFVIWMTKYIFLRNHSGTKRSKGWNTSCTEPGRKVAGRLSLLWADCVCGPLCRWSRVCLGPQWLQPAWEWDDQPRPGTHPGLHQPLDQASGWSSLWLASFNGSGSWWRGKCPALMLCFYFYLSIFYFFLGGAFLKVSEILIPWLGIKLMLPIMEVGSLNHWSGRGAPHLFPCSSNSKESACHAGDLGSVPGLGRSSGEGNSNPFQYPCLENP